MKLPVLFFGLTVVFFSSAAFAQNNPWGGQGKCTTICIDPPECTIWETDCR